MLRVSLPSVLMVLGNADPNMMAVLNDELETTMKMCGITNLDQVHPGLLNTLAVDHLIPTTDDHPYAKWRPKQRSKI